MRRRYAFEAEGVPEKVENALEKLEDQVDQHCDTVADCEAAEKKIDDKIGEFDGALQAMAGAAKDCKDGKCSKEEMGETIKSSMTDLKKLAGEIGVANESDSELASEDEIKDAKAYLEGAKEIVEAKKDELESGSSEEGGSSDEGEGDDGEASAEECDAVESFVDACLEAYLDDLDGAMESEIFDMAMEGVTSDAVSSFMQHKSQIRSIKAEMKAAEKSKDYSTAAAKAKEAAGVADQIINDINNLPAQSIGKAALVNIALAIAAMIAAVAVIGTGGKLLKAVKGSKPVQSIGNALNNAKSTRQATKLEKLGGADTEKGAAYLEKLHKKNHPEPGKIGKAIDKAKAAPGKAAGAVKAQAGKVGSKVGNSKIGQGITNAASNVSGAAHKGYDATVGKAVGKAGELAGKAGSHIPAGVKNAAGKAGSAAMAAGKAGANVGVKGAAVGGAATAGAVVFLKKKGAVDADGNPTSSALDGKDVNGLIALMKIDAKKLKQKYLDAAAAYEEMASNASSSSATESFMEAIEGFMIAAGIDMGESNETAMESDTGDFDSFLDNLWG